jgi:hypothetical protein
MFDESDETLAQTYGEERLGYCSNKKKRGKPDAHLLMGRFEVIYANRANVLASI